MPDATLEAPVFNQHPDTLIKKAKREAPAAPETQTPDPVVVAEEQKTLDQLKAELPSLLFGDKKKEPTPEEKAKAEEAKKAEETKKAAEAEAAKTDEQKAAEEKKTRVRRAPDALEVARETGRAIAEGLRKNEAQTQPETATAKPVDNLSAEDKDTYELFKVLSDSDPKYKGKHDEFLAFVKKAAAYRKRWEKENPGSSFDPEDSQHEDFYDANQPQFEELDLEMARVRREASVEVQRQLDEQKKEYERRLQEIEDKSVGPEVARQAAVAADKAVGDFIAALPDEKLKEASKDAAKLKEQDPLAFDVLDREAAVLRQEVGELHNIIHRANYFQPTNPMHQHLARFVSHQEDSIKQLPLEQQIFEGKRFATRDEMAKMPPAQRAQHWGLTEADVVDIMTKSSSKRAAKILADERVKLEQQATRYGFVRGSGATTTQAAAPNSAASTASTAHKPSAPAAPSGGALPPVNAPGTQAQKPTEKQLVDLLW